jgi:hypothetical protein
MSDSALPPDVRRWLCPAVEVPFTFLGYALGAAFAPNKSEGLSPDQGRSPRIIRLLSAEDSHRRTSGGKAEAPHRRTFRAKPFFTIRLSYSSIPYDHHVQETAVPFLNETAVSSSDKGLSYRAPIFPQPSHWQTSHH